MLHPEWQLGVCPDPRLRVLPAPEHLAQVDDADDDNDDDNDSDNDDDNDNDDDDYDDNDDDEDPIEFPLVASTATHLIIH